MAIAASEQNDFDSLLGGEGYFKIPKYQRRYSWGAKQQIDLFNDLYEGFELENDHFCNTLSIQKIESESKYVRTNSYEIIDGQQRFTSLYIMLFAIANFAEDEDLKQTLTVNKKYKLIPINEEDEIVLDKVLKNEDEIKTETKSQELMKECYKIYLREIKIKFHDDKEEIKKFGTYVLKGAKFLVYLVQKKIDAIRMFKIINDRGLPLTSLEKIKANLLYHSTRYLDEELNNKIDNVFTSIYKYLDQKDNLINLEDDNIIRYHYQSKSNLKISTTGWGYTNGIAEMLELMGKSINKAENKKEVIEEYLDDLNEFIEAINRINQKSKDEILYREFFKYMRIHARVYPLTIRLEINKLLSQDILKLIEVLEFYLLMRRKPMQEVFNIIHFINDEETPSPSLEDTKDKIKDIISNQHKHVSIDKLLSIDNLDSNLALKKYLLYKYNKSLYPDNIESINYSKLEIEHILPEKLTGSLRNLGFGKERLYLERYLYSIGNLTILEKDLNIKATNKSMVAKIEIYKDSKIEMNHYMNLDFNKDAIDERHEEILKFGNEYFLDKI